MLNKLKLITYLSALSLLALISQSAQAEYSADNMNKKIAQANASNQSWVKNLVAYPLNLFSLNEFKQLNYQLTYDFADSPTQAQMNIILNGYLDDSVNGEIIVLTFNKKGNIWQVNQVTTQVICDPERQSSGTICN